MGTRLRARRFRIIAQDPSVLDAKGGVLTAEVSLPWEDVEAGPMGAAIYVVDYDGSARCMYGEAPNPDEANLLPDADSLCGDPRYHAYNVYAIVMRTLLRFEQALGRRVAWGIRGHQLKIVPHAFNDANSYYSPEMESLLFGYVRGDPTTFLCLSHDVVVHETTHALLDGLRDKFNAPSSADQAALHEAFADIVALLSVFSLKEITAHLLELAIAGEPERECGTGVATARGFVQASRLSVASLKSSALFGLAEGMRTAAPDVRINALRRSVMIEPHRDILNRAEYAEEHRRGEVLVAAIMDAFASAWGKRISALADSSGGVVNLEVVAEYGCDIADILLTMAIRAIDYTPPIHIVFGDYLAAMLTADDEVRLDDTRYDLRDQLRQSMRDYGIDPPIRTLKGRWRPPKRKLVRAGSHFDGLQSDPTEMFRFIWRNRGKLRLNPEAHTRVASIRPCVRVSPQDGFQLRETVVECTQYLRLKATELPSYGLTAPEDMPGTTDVVLEGGSTLILDEFGELKYEITNLLPEMIKEGQPRRDVSQWQKRLQYLWDRGYLDSDGDFSSKLAAFHRELDLAADSDGARDAVRQTRLIKERW